MRPQRHVAFLSLVAGTVAAFALLASAATSIAQSIDTPQRVAFQIATGSTTGSYFPVGQMLADLLSHPPGVGRCQTNDVCGPAGLIVSTRASEGSIANVNGVNSGNVSSGIAQADVVALAVAGKGPFVKAGPAKQVRVIANLYGEDVHLLVAKTSNIKAVADLKGKRVSLDEPGSGTLVDARIILGAYGLTEKDVTAEYLKPNQAGDKMRDGGLDAFFFVGGYPTSAISELASAGGGVDLVPVTGPEVDKMLKQYGFFAVDTIPANTYKGIGEVKTIAVGAQWVTSAKQPDALIYEITKAVWNDNSRKLLDAGHAKGKAITKASATAGAGIPFHPGAEKFYKEAGLLK